MPNVMIIAPANDLHALAVSRALNVRSVNVRILDLGQLGADVQFAVRPTGGMGVDLTDAEGLRERFSTYRAIWWRRPKIPVLDSKLEETTAAYVRSEWRHFIEGLETVSCSSTRWVNRPSVQRHADLKLVQLLAAQEVGLRVPRTLVTNDPVAVPPFLAAEREVVFKRLGDTPRPLSATRLFRSEDLERLKTLERCPAIFQEHIRAKFDIRVTMFGDRIHATEIHSQDGASPLDWRFDHTVPFLRHQLDSKTHGQLLDLLDRLRLEYAAIDMRLTPQGEYVFLEVNPSGQFLFIELLTRQPLTETMADLLIADPG